MNAQKSARSLKPMHVKSRDTLWKAKEMVRFTAWLTRVVLTRIGTSIYAQQVVCSLHLALNAVLLDAFFLIQGVYLREKSMALTCLCSVVLRDWSSLLQSVANTSFKIVCLEGRRYPCM